MAFSPETYALLKAQGGGGGGSSLPSVTEADNGKVLSVVNGAWAAANKSGLCISSSGTLDKSYNDLAAMLNNGILPWIYETNGEYSGDVYMFFSDDSSEGDYYVTFSHDNNTYAFTSSDASEPMQFAE